MTGSDAIDLAAARSELEALRERVIAAAEQVGLSTVEFARDLRDPTTAHEIERNCVAAVTEGVFGTPTLRIEEKLFWGNDRLPLARHYLQTVHEGHR